MHTEEDQKMKQHSKKNLTRIRLRGKTQKNIKPQQRINRKNHANSATPHLLQPLPERSKGKTPDRRRQKNYSAQFRLGKTEEAKFRSQLPEITDHRISSGGWDNRTNIKFRPEPSKSSKIAFKELIPIKEVSKETRLQNFRIIREQFRQVVNASNFVSVKNVETVFRAYVEKGNNGILMKELLKKRWWWHLEQHPSKANLLWTEWFNTPFVSQMGQEEKRDNKMTNYAPMVSAYQPKLTSVRKILDESTFNNYQHRISLRDEHYFRTKNNNKKLLPTTTTNSELKEIQSVNSNLIHNHIDGCLQLHSKKLLFRNIVQYFREIGSDPFQIMPVTYYIDDEECFSLRELYNHCEVLSEDQQSMNMWIVKPGENSNRGFGISVHIGKESLQKEIEERLSQGRSSLIVQKYIQNCFLIDNRKFDIRCYILLTTVNGILKGYWYSDGYIRTSSEEYSKYNADNLMVHLTNQAVQRNNQSYGKYQDFNKMSFDGFRKYLRKCGYSSSAFDNAYEKMRNIAFYLIAAVSHKIRRKQYTFQLFGLDFMLDNHLQPFLIQANSNPSLQNHGLLLSKLVYQLLDNVLMTAVDPLFPAPTKSRAKEYLSKDYFRSNKFELIYTDKSNL